MSPWTERRFLGIEGRRETSERERERERERAQTHGSGKLGVRETNVSTHTLPRRYRSRKFPSNLKVAVQEDSVRYEKMSRFVFQQYDMRVTMETA